MHGTEDDNLVSGSGNLANALDHIAGEGFDDDFLTGDDVTIAQIHSLASSKPSAPISTPPPIMVPETSSDPAFSLPSQSPRTISEETEVLSTTTEPAPMKYQVASLPSPGRTTSNTSSMVSSEAGAGLIVSPLPKVSPRSNMSSPGRKPKSSIEHQPSSSTDTATPGAGGGPKPRRPSGNGGLPRVAMLAANKPTPKREETQRNTPPPFRSGGSTVRPASLSASASGRGRSPTTPGALGTTTSNRERLSGTSASSSPVTRGGTAGAAGGVSRSSSRSSIASGSSSSRLATSSSTNSRPVWGSTAGGAPTRSTSARNTTTNGPAATAAATRRTITTTTGGPPSQSMRPTPTTAATRRTLSTSSVGAGRGRVVARSSSPSKIPSGPGRTTSARSTREPAAGAGAVTATAVGATAALVGNAVEEPEDVSLDTLVGLMGEIKDIRHELDMNTPTAADGADNADFGSAVIEAEDSLPGPEFIASVDSDGVTAALAEGASDGGEVVEKKESTGDGEEETELGTAAAGVAGEEGKENGESGVVIEDSAAGVVEEEPVPEVAVRPAFEFEQHPVAANVDQEKIQAKPLCSCSIM